MELMAEQLGRLAKEGMGWHECEEGGPYWESDTRVECHFEQWQPEHNIEQAMGLLDAMHERGWREIIDTLNGYMVKMFLGPTYLFGVLQIGLREERCLLICLAVLAALDAEAGR